MMARIKIKDLSTDMRIRGEMMRKVLGGLSKYGHSSETQFLIVRELLDYLHNHPDACDTLSGISKKWLG